MRQFGRRMSYQGVLANHDGNGDESVTKGLMRKTIAGVQRQAIQNRLK